MIARQVRWYIAMSIMLATTLVPRARDEENHFPARWTRRTNRQSSRPSVVTGMSSTIVTGSYWQSCTPRCLRKQKILLLRSHRSQERLNQTMERKIWVSDLTRSMERKNVFKHIFQGYILPKDKQSMISKTGYNVENSLGKGGEESHDITHTTVLG